jgi:hypothetical protein
MTKNATTPTEAKKAAKTPVATVESKPAAKAAAAAQAKPAAKATAAAADAKPASAEKKPARKPPINPFTAENGRKLGRGGKGPSRTAWKA